MNKRLLGGLLAAGIIGGGVYGFAATLEPTSDQLGAGGDDVESCDTAIKASYTVAYTTTGYEVVSVDLSGIDAACDGQDYRITLSDGDDASLKELTGTIGQTGGEQTVTLPTADNILAQAVEGIDVVVTSADPT